MKNLILPLGFISIMTAGFAACGSDKPSASSVSSDQTALSKDDANAKKKKKPGPDCLDTYQVESQAQLSAIRDCPSSTYILNNDISLNGLWTPIASFSGSLDGRGRTISGLTITAGNNAAFISSTTNTAVITDLNFSGARVTGGSSVAILVGTNAGKVTRCKSVSGAATGFNDVGGLVGTNSGPIDAGIVTGGTVQGIQQSAKSTNSGLLDHIGGLVGFNKAAAISNSSSTATVTAAADSVSIGGLIGANGDVFRTGNAALSFVAGGPVTNCSFAGSVTQQGYSAKSTSEFTSNVGGLIGLNRKGAVSNSTSSGGVARPNSSRRLLFAMGGLVGTNDDGVIVNSSSTASVTGGSLDGAIGGLVGYGGTIMSSYATGTVNGTGFVGGLAGSGARNIYHSHANGLVSGSGYLGGLIGYAGGSNIFYSSSASEVELLGAGIGAGLVAFGGKVTDSYATGSVTGDDVDSILGGLAGMAVQITRSFATGRLAGPGTLGGLMGKSSSAPKVLDSFWDTQVSGVTASAGGIGKTTAALRDRSSYPSSWDFNNVWSQSGSGAPQIRDFADNAPSGPPLCGNGSLATPVRSPALNIWNADELLVLQRKIPGYSRFALACDLDLGGMEWTPIKNFSADFDGNYRKISHLTITTPGDGNVGLFSAFTTSATVEHVWLKDVNINVTGARNVGGIVGRAGGGAWLAANSVTGKINGGSSPNIGGLAGSNSDSTQIIYSYSKASVAGSGGRSTCIGGLVGLNDGTARIMASYAAGLVTGTTAGGIAGCNSAGASVFLTNIWDKQATGQATSAGAAVGKTTAEMQQKSGYPAFDFVVAFAMPDSGSGYPVMACHLNENTGAFLQPSGQGCAHDL